MTVFIGKFNYDKSHILFSKHITVEFNQNKVQQVQTLIKTKKQTD